MQKKEAEIVTGIATAATAARNVIADGFLRVSHEKL